MQKEIPMETVVSAAPPAPVETPVPGLAAPSVLNAVIAARGKIVTRLDALKEYVLSYMDVERRRNANSPEIRPDELPYILQEAEQILSDLRDIGGYAGVEDEIAMREEAAESAS
jgi:hypothetical protein